MTEHFDVIVVGAGISGVGAGYRLQTECPGKRYVCWRAGTTSAARGTCSATPASVPTRTCTR